MLIAIVVWPATVLLLGAGVLWFGTKSVRGDFKREDNERDLKYRIRRVKLEHDAAKQLEHHGK